MSFELFFIARGVTTLDGAYSRYAPGYKEGSKNMGVGRIFSRGGGTRGFFQIFSRVGQKWWNCFFPLKSKKSIFFAKNFKIQWGKAPPAPPFPTPVGKKQVWRSHVRTWDLSEATIVC